MYRANTKHIVTDLVLSVALYGGEQQQRQQQQQQKLVVVVVVVVCCYLSTNYAESFLIALARFLSRREV